MNALLGSRGHQQFPVENYTGTLIHNQIMGRATLFSTDLAFHNTRSLEPLRIYLQATEGKYFQTMLSVSSNMAHPQISAILSLPIIITIASPSFSCIHSHPQFCFGPNYLNVIIIIFIVLIEKNKTTRYWSQRYGSCLSA